MRSYGGVLDPRGSKLALLKSTFNSKNFIRRSSWSISSDFDRRRSSLFDVCGRLESRKNSLKTPILGFKSFKVIDLGTPGKLISSACYDMQQVSVSICNHSRARLVDSSRNRAFWRGYANLMRLYWGLVEPRGSNLTPFEVYVQCRTFHMQVALVYLEWFRRNSLLKCVLQPEITKNSLKPLIWGVHGRSRYHHLGTTWKLVNSACYDKQQVGVYLQPFSR